MSSANVQRGAARRAIAVFAVRRAFTLIELIVVILVLAVLGGLIAPRLVGNQRRQGDSEAKEIAGLISAAARRAELSSEAVAVDFNGKMNRLSVLRLQEAAPGGAGSGRGGSKGVWAEDLFVTPLTLSTLAMEKVGIDGRAAPLMGWRAEFSPGRPKPSVYILLELAESRSRGRGQGWEVWLDAEALEAQSQAQGSTQGATGTVRRIDLDAAGQAEKAW